MTPDQFRATLKSLGLSQRALSERFHQPASTVNRWAVGAAPVPGYAAEYLRVLALLRATEQQLREA